MPKLDGFKVGDRVELMLFYSLEDEARPTGRVVNIGKRRILCKMDTHGRIVGLHPGDLRLIKRGEA